MTARGRPESGVPDEKRQANARQRLVEAGHELLHDDFPPPISAINLSPALHMTERGVYQMMDRAGWEIGAVQEAVNSVHMGCRNDQ